MANLVRDTAFGYLTRFAFGASALPHPDEVDLPHVWRDAVRREASPDPARTPDTDITVANHSARNSIAADNEESADLVAQRHMHDHDHHHHLSAPIDRKLERSPSTISDSTYIDPSAVNAKSDGEKTPSEKEKAIENKLEQVVKAEQGHDHLLVGWYGPDDTDNPQNWSLGRKLWILFQTCFLTFGIYIGSSIYTAGIQDVMLQFGVSEVAATLGLSLFVAGYGLGPMLFAPLSEIPQIGRMPVYMVTLIIFVLLQIPTALAGNFGTLLAFRFLTGFFGSPILAVGGATIADIYAPRYRAYAITIWGLFGVLGPVLGPLVGGFAAAAEGWTWTIWELMWLSGSAFALLFFFYPETNPSTILYHRARRLRRATGNEGLRAQSEIDAANITLNDVVTIALIRPITLNFQEPIVLALNLYIGLVYALLYLWFESFPIVFIGIYGFTDQTLGLSFLGILIGALAVAPPFFLYLKYVQEPKYSETGELKPETRLPVAIFGAIILPICLFWFGWSSRPSVHWIVPIIGSSLFGFAVLLLFNVVLNYLADAYPLYAASVLAGNDLVRSSFGATFPLFARAMYNKLGVGWASSLLGFLAIAFIPIPILLYIYGEKIRLYSKRARHDY